MWRLSGGVLMMAMEARLRGRWADNGGNAGGRGEWEVYRDY